MTVQILHLRCFTEVAQLGSITRAAKRLNIAQSALSRRIHQLELAVGLELFSRHVGGVRMTEPGRRFLVRAERVLKEYDSFCEAMQIRDPLEPKIKLGITATAADLLLSSSAHSFHERYPHIRFQAIAGTSEHLISWLTSGELDLALVTNGEPTRSLESLPVWRETLFLVAPPEVGKEKIKVGDLQHLPFILTSHSRGVRQTLEAAFRRAGCELCVALEMDAISSVKQMVCAGQAYTVLPYQAVTAEVAAGKMRVSRMPYAYIDRVLLRRAGFMSTAASRQFLSVLLAEIAERVAPLGWARLLVSQERPEWR